MLTLARWCSTHRRMVVSLWVIVLLGVGAAWQGVGSHYSSNFTLGRTGAQRAADLLKSRFPAQSGDVDQIVFKARTGRLTDAGVRAAVAPMLAEVARLPHVTGVISPFDPKAGTRISKDGTIGFATVLFDQRANVLPTSAIKKVIARAESIRSDRLQVELGGQAIEQTQFAAPSTTTGIGILAAVVVLLISFGSFLAMGLPIVTALFGLGTGIALIGLGTHVLAMPNFALELAGMIGLGVGIDYALFILSRFREIYRENGGDVHEAVALAMDTAGRAVLFAGATVVIALLGMFALGVSFLYGLAIAASLAVLLVLTASITLLPALLTFFGRRLGAPGWLARLFSRRRRPTTQPRPGFWSALDRRHPAPPGRGGDCGDGADADAGRAGALAAARLERRRQRPHLVHDQACLRPARTGFRPRLQRSARAGREAARRARHCRADRDRRRRRAHPRRGRGRAAATESLRRRGRDHRLSRVLAPERDDDDARQAPAQTRCCRRSSRARARRSTSAAQRRRSSTSPASSPRSCGCSWASSSRSPRCCCSSSSARC